jgi:hypothetical protein
LPFVLSGSMCGPMKRSLTIPAHMLCRTTANAT